MRRFFFIVLIVTSMKAFPENRMKAAQLSSFKQIGVAIEDHIIFLTPFIIVNQLFPNHFFYELRANYIRAYVSQIPPAPPVVPTKISQLEERGLNGGGGIVILGYMFALNPRVDFMLYTRLQVLTNQVTAYKDTLGNKLRSVNYNAFLGGKLFMKINDVFSIYVQYFAGPRRSELKGKGVFKSTNNFYKPKINTFVSTMELDLAYKITPKIKLTPYIQYVTLFNHPNSIAANSPYNINALTTIDTVYAIRLEYLF